MLESKLQAKCVKLAKRNKIMVRKIHAENRKGFPDLLLIFPDTGIVAFVEMKRPDGTGQLSKLQDREIGRIRKQGANAYQCMSYSRFLSILTLHLPGIVQGRDD